MKPQFQADNDLDQRIVDALLRLDSRIEFKTAVEAGFHGGAPDSEVYDPQQMKIGF